MSIRFLALPRSGSTWITNLLVASGCDVHKEHVIRGKYNFITYRDIRDSMISYAIALETQFNTIDDIHRFIVHGPGQYIIRSIDVIKGMMIPRQTTPILRYRKFKNDPDYAFDFFKEHLNLHVPNRKEIIEKFTMDKMKKIQKRYRNFSEWDPKTMIHGNHIAGGDIDRWKTYFKNEELKKTWNNMLEPHVV